MTGALLGWLAYVDIYAAHLVAIGAMVMNAGWGLD